MSRRMLFRFSLYGFLKNQKYYEPFLILALSEKGLRFFTIGLLIGFRQVWVNILEIPSGFIADTLGRRRSLIASFGAYIVSFIVLAFSGQVLTLFMAMFFFAVGEAFRSGTHKAMILDWLTSQGRSDDRTRVYGYTRSWSQIGSAVSALLAALAVVLTENYTTIFWLSAIPYMAGIVNVLGYPAFLDGTTGRGGELSIESLPALVRRFFRVLTQSLGNRPLRRLFIESAAYRGNAGLTKDYLQPLLRQAAVGLPVWLALNAERRTAILVGVVYSALYLISSLFSRGSHRFVQGSGGRSAAALGLWMINVVLFFTAAGFIVAGLDMAAVVLLALVVVMQNIWRPVMLSRIDEVSEAATGATVLSMDSQAGSFYILIFAPLLGLAVDSYELWPVAAFGGVSALVFCLLSSHRWGR